MKFIPGHFDIVGNIICDASDEFESEINKIEEMLRADNVKKCHECYLCLPSDYPNYGMPINPNVSREEYLKNPAKYGIAIYKGRFGNIQYE